MTKNFNHAIEYSKRWIEVMHQERVPEDVGKWVIEVEPSFIREVAGRLAEYECVSYVACSIGESDVSVQVVARDTKSVYHFSTEVIGKMSGVRKTTTSIVPIVMKAVYQWRVPRGEDGPAGGLEK